MVKFHFRVLQLPALAAAYMATQMFFVRGSLTQQYQNTLTRNCKSAQWLHEKTLPKNQPAKTYLSPCMLLRIFQGF